MNKRSNLSDVQKEVITDFRAKDGSILQTAESVNSTLLSRQHMKRALQNTLKKISDMEIVAVVQEPSKRCAAMKQLTAQMNQRYYCTFFHNESSLKVADSVSNFVTGSKSDRTHLGCYGKAAQSSKTTMSKYPGFTWHPSQCALQLFFGPEVGQSVIR